MGRFLRRALFLAVLPAAGCASMPASAPVAQDPEMRIVVRNESNLGGTVYMDDHNWGYFYPGNGLSPGDEKSIYMIRGWLNDKFQGHHGLVFVPSTPGTSMFTPNGVTFNERDCDYNRRGTKTARIVSAAPGTVQLRIQISCD